MNNKTENEPIKEEMVDAGDTIEVPDELIEAMGAKPEEKEQEKPAEKPAEQKAEKPAETEEKPAAKAESETKEEDAEAKPEKWQPKHNPEYYKEKGRKTREHIKDLTTRRFEADQRAETAERELAEAREMLAAMEAREGGGSTKKIKELDAAIELAEEDGSDFVVEALREKREALAKREPQQPQQPQQGRPRLAQAAGKWLEDNDWYGARDELGRIAHPQLMAEANRRESALLKTMPMGQELYQQLDNEMAMTLDAWGLKKSKPGNGAEKKESPEEKPKPGLQPSRTGGAEGADTTRDRMTDEEHERMVFLAKQTRQDPNDPAYRKAFLRQIRS